MVKNFMAATAEFGRLECEFEAILGYIIRLDLGGEEEEEEEEKEEGEAEEQEDEEEEENNNKHYALYFCHNFLISIGML